MKDALVAFFWEHATLIVFLHVLSAVVWVGGMIAMRFAAHYAFMALEPPVRLARTAQALKRLFAIVSPFVALLIITAVLMAVGWGFRAAAVDADGNVIDQTAYTVYNLVHVKEAIWLLMTVNLIAMILRRNKAQKLIDAGDLAGAKPLLGLIGKYMVPVNIVLGIIAIYLGVTLRYSHA
jgi:uncharacterized membrane protein